MDELRARQPFVGAEAAVRLEAGQCLANVANTSDGHRLRMPDDEFAQLLGIKGPYAHRWVREHAAAEAAHGVTSLFRGAGRT